MEIELSSMTLTLETPQRSQDAPKSLTSWHVYTIQHARAYLSLPF